MNPNSMICKNCGSSNTYRIEGKQGMFVSYYYIICKDCKYERECRESG